jgi:hypothetical protein
MTYAWETTQCNFGMYLRQTNNLRLMSDQMILEMCHAAKTGELKGFMHKIIEKYKNDGKTEVLNDMVNGMVSALGNSQYIGNHINDGDAEFNSANYIKYDPYLLSSKPTTYGAPLRFGYFQFNNSNQYIHYLHHSCGGDNGTYGGWNNISDNPDLDPTTSGAYWTTIRGWYLPYYTSRIAANADGYIDIPEEYIPNELDKVVSYFYPQKDGSFVSNSEEEGALLDLVGEIFFYKPEDEDTGSTLQKIPPFPVGGSGTSSDDDYYSWVRGLGGLPRGIFGRNLRYNLDKFRTATVFYHEQNGTLVQTMPFVNLNSKKHVSIPIVYVNGWYTQTLDCTPQSGSLCVADGGVACGGLGECQTSLNCSGNPDCPPAGGSASGANWYINTGLIATSEDFTIQPLQSIQPPTTNKTKSKNVLIADGICVNMLCPECELYESC